MLSHFGDRRVHRNDNQLDVIYRLIFFFFNRSQSCDYTIRFCASVYISQCFMISHADSEIIILTAPDDSQTLLVKLLDNILILHMTFHRCGLRFLLKTNERTFVHVTLITSRKGIQRGWD